MGKLCNSPYQRLGTDDLHILHDWNNMNSAFNCTVFRNPLLKTHVFEIIEKKSFIHKFKNKYTLNYQSCTIRRCTVHKLRAFCTSNTVHSYKAWTHLTTHPHRFHLLETHHCCHLAFLAVSVLQDALSKPLQKKRAGAGQVCSYAAALRSCTMQL